MALRKCRFSRREDPALGLLQAEGLSVLHVFVRDVFEVRNSRGSECFQLTENLVSVGGLIQEASSSSGRPKYARASETLTAPHPRQC